MLGAYVAVMVGGGIARGLCQQAADFAGCTYTVYDGKAVSCKRCMMHSCFARCMLLLVVKLMLLVVLVSFVQAAPLVCVFLPTCLLPLLLPGV